MAMILSAPTTVTVNVPGTSVLGSVAASMAPGTWAQLNTNNQNAVLGVGNSTGNMLPYSTTGVWNPVNRCVEFLGNDHGWPDGLRHVRYQESNNTWVHVGHASSAAHGYDHLEVDRTTGDLYHRVYHYGSGGQIRRLPYGGSWANWSSISAHMQVSIGMCYWTGTHSAISGTKGALVFFDGDFGALVGRNVSSLANINFGSASVSSPGYDTVAAYSPTHNVCVFGGGAKQPRRIWRMNSSGQITELAQAPAGCRIGTYNGILTEDPATGHFLVLSGRRIWQLNPTGSGSWTEQTGSRIPPSAVNDPASTQEVIGIPLHGLGVTMYVSMTVKSGNSYLYRHA